MASFRFGRKRAVALLLVLALAAGAWAFDWNWLVPSVERHFSADSGREVHIESLHVGLDPQLRPRVRLNGVRIQNADWTGSTKPMVVAGEVEFRFTWASIWLRQPLVVTQLTLIDADVELFRRADGVRNWRLRRPDDTEPGRVVIQAMDAQRSRLRFVHQGVDLDVAFVASLPAEPQDTVAGYPITRQIDFTGRWHGAPFEGRAYTAERITFQQTDQWMPLRGNARSGDSRLELEGRAADLFHLSQVDAELRVRGPSLAALGSFVPVQLPATAPYRLTAHLTKEQREFTFVKLQAEVGKTDLAGELRYDQARTSPHLEASLTSGQAHLADLTGLMRTTPAKPDAAPDRLLPVGPLGTAGLRRLDAEVDLRVRELHTSASLPALQGVRLQAALDGGQLDVKPIGFGWAGGRVSGTLHVDATQDPPNARADVQWSKLRIEDLLPDVPDDQRIAGPVSGRMVVEGRGASIADIARRGTGSLALHMNGGKLPGKLDARLSLNATRLLRSLVSSGSPVPIHCGELVADLRDGRLRTRAVAFETAQTRLAGEGVLDLRDERYELSLDPQPKKGALLTLPQSIRVQGHLSASPEVTLGAARAIDGEPCDPAKPRAELVAR